jgi:Zn-dependent M28 family amino/carboxypeptidase
MARTRPAIEVAEDTLREVEETLAPIDRTPCSPGEWEAAQWIEQRLKAAGCSEVALEEERSWGTWPPTLVGLGTLGVVAGILALRRRRAAGAVMALAALGGILDEIQNGPRILRRVVRRPKTTVNLVARTGDTTAANTLVVIAHHDAAQTGLIFRQGFARWLHRRAPERIERSKQLAPVWAGVLAGPLLTLVSSITGKRGAAKGGLLLSAASTAFMADILRSPTVPGANDNLSGVSVLVALAEQLHAHPVPDLRVFLVSCGAEETLQDGIRAFIARHTNELDRDRTCFLNFDTVGSSHLVMLEGEGPAWMEEYAGPEFRDLVARSAQDAGVPLERGVRTHASTDGIVCSRAGFSTATVISLEPWRQPSNYHLITDVPERLNYDTIAGAVRLGYAVAEALGSGAGGDT